MRAEVRTQGSGFKLMANPFAFTTLLVSLLVVLDVVVLVGVRAPFGRAGLSRVSLTK